MSTGSALRRPLRERLPGYLSAFGFGLGAGGLVGLVIGLATSARLVDALGYTYSALGALLLLVGGIRGSGYGQAATRAGASAAGEPGRAREGEAPALPGAGAAATGKLDALERRRRRLLAPPDPAAFWQVVAGCVYFGLGLLLTVAFAAD